MLKGIRMSFGAIFVTDGRFTVRYDGAKKCAASKISYKALEYDLRTEPPEMWAYLSETEILALPNGAGDLIQNELRRIRKKHRIKE